MIYTVAATLAFLWSHAGPFVYFTGLVILALVVLRAFARVKGESPIWERLWGSTWFYSMRTFRIAVLIAAVILACTCVNLADHALRDLVAKDVVDTIQDVRERAAGRLYDRTADLARRISAYRPSEEDPPPPAWAVRSSKKSGLPVGEAIPLVVGMSSWKQAEKSFAWKAIVPLLKPVDGAPAIAPGEIAEKLREYRRRGERLKAGGEADESKSQADQKNHDLETAQWRRRFQVDDTTSLDPYFQALAFLFLDPDGAKLASQDVLDLQCLFDCQRDQFAVKPRVLKFLANPWGPDPLPQGAYDPTQEQLENEARLPNILEKLVVDKYAEAIPEILRRDPGADASLVRRLGTTYQEPSPHELATVISGEIDRVYRPKADAIDLRYAQMLIAFTLAESSSRPDVPDRVEPTLYDHPNILTVREYVFKKMFSGVQEGVGKAIESRSSGKRPFDLQVTWMQLRAIIRGPIQLVTFCVFFWGLLTLVVQGILLEMVPQLSYWIATTRPGPRYDAYQVWWSEIWIGYRSSARDPVFRQILTSGRRLGDLFPQLLRHMFLAVESGKTYEETASSVQQAADVWLKDREAGERFYEFVGWLLPSIGFFGTAIGIGRAMAMANRIMTTDADVQARAISNITEALGTKFYTTLVALACAIAFGFVVLGYRSLKTVLVQSTKRRALRYLRTRIRFNTAGAPQAEIKRSRPSPEIDLPIFLGILGRMIEIRLGRDVLEGHPSARSITLETAPLLRSLILHTGVVDEHEWQDEERSPWAFERIPGLIAKLPPWLQPLGKVLYVLEIRTTKAHSRSLGLVADAKASHFHKTVFRLADGYLCRLDKKQVGPLRLLRKLTRQRNEKKWLLTYRRLKLRTDVARGWTDESAMRWILSADEKGHRALRLLADISFMLDLDSVAPPRTAETTEPDRAKNPEPASNGFLKHTEANGESKVSKPIGV
ncbi:MAG TPA: MotA/TolQ/ExbB proton channel family protein [Pirellulales bacterium]|nr:MotA/TolQ/ExbB proton channel family protein [Pirellulales bacterium]